jgi:dTDP-4-dehydrorhamnose reductase
MEKSKVMKVLVLGSGGMAGHVICLYLRDAGFLVDTLSAHQSLDDKTTLLDVASKHEFEKFLNHHEYDIIINCIGLLVKQSEDRKDLASYINAYLPHFLENKYLKSKTKIIHLSTDCVFSGSSAPYKENSLYDGELFYDRSKALGEIINDKDLTFRMSIIGPDMQKKGIGLFNWFYSQTGEIFGYTNAIWNGVTTVELARGIQSAIEQNLTGLYHLVPKENISKYNLLKLLSTTFERNDIHIKPDGKVSLDKTLINTRDDFIFTVHDYPTMLSEMKHWIIKHQDIYPQYTKAN